MSKQVENKTISEEKYQERPGGQTDKKGKRTGSQADKLDYGKTFLIGTGFFASSLLWSIYNSFIPLILKDFIASTAIIGLIMTIDNIFGVIFQPLFGALSDRTRTRFGKRMPFIMVAAPLCAGLFFFIPQMPNLVSLMALVIVFNFGMSVWRAPIVALMPDLTPDKHWSKANGVINLMGGVASIIAFLVGGRIANAYGRSATFAMGSVIMLVAVLVLFSTIKEPEAFHFKKFGKVQSEDPGGDQSLDQVFDSQAAEKGQAADSQGSKQKKSKQRLSLANFKKLAPADRHNLVYLLLAIFFWFCAYNAVETFFTSFAVARLGVPEGSAAMLLAFFSVSFVAFAIPSGFIASKIGRRKAIIIGLVGLSAVFIPILFLMNLTAIRVLLLVGGFFWAMININSLPMVLEIGQKSEIGTYTGYYYFFSFAASIFSPILYGFIRDLSGSFGSLFIYAPILFVLALVCILRTKPLS